MGTLIYRKICGASIYEVFYFGGTLGQDYRYIGDRLHWGPAYRDTSIYVPVPANAPPSSTFQGVLVALSSTEVWILLRIEAFPFLMWMLGSSYGVDDSIFRLWNRMEFSKHYCIL